MTFAASSGHILLPCMNCLFFNSSSHLPIPHPLCFWRGWYKFCCHHPSWSLLSSCPAQPKPRLRDVAPPMTKTMQSFSCQVLGSFAELHPEKGKQWVVPFPGQTCTHRNFAANGRRFRWEKLCRALPIWKSMSSQTGLELARWGRKEKGRKGGKMKLTTMVSWGWQQ